MTQQESYYIMEQKEGAKPFVGLGFTEGTTGKELLQAVESAHSSGTPLKVEEYVNILDANKGDLFLIPPGAVHFSGKNNLVLEISSTTWWFTFKIYDHLRVDRDGRPRPINSDHARPNMKEQFDTQYVQEHLIAVPRECRVQGASSEELLGEREDLLFQVKRLTLDGEWNDDTAGEFVMFNLVEGDRVRLTPLDDEAAAVEWGYAEAYIVPASVGGFRMESLGDRSCTLIRAQVSPEWNMPLLPHHWKSGGTFLKGGVLSDGDLLPQFYVKRSSRSNSSAYEIAANLADVIQELAAGYVAYMEQLSSDKETPVGFPNFHIGFAFPGPFEYE
ncbi:hypothetical protein PC115_g24679, partial [Phytophthora cactorum]